MLDRDQDGQKSSINCRLSLLQYSAREGVVVSQHPSLWARSQPERLLLPLRGRYARSHRAMEHSPSILMGDWKVRCWQQVRNLEWADSLNTAPRTQRVWPNAQFFDDTMAHQISIELRVYSLSLYGPCKSRWLLDKFISKITALEAGVNQDLTLLSAWLLC